MYAIRSYYALVYLARETEVWLEVTTLLIPGENDSPTELEADGVTVLVITSYSIHYTKLYEDQGTARDR